MHAVSEYNHRSPASRAAQLILFTGLCLVLATDKFFGLALVLLLLLSLVLIAKTPPKNLGTLDWLFISTLCLYPAIVLIDLLSRGAFTSSEFDTPSRFLLVIPLYLMARMMSGLFAAAVAGAIGGCIITAVYSLAQIDFADINRVSGHDNGATYAQIAFLLALVACIPLGLATRIPASWRKLLPLCIIGITLFSIMATQIRGVLIFLPLLFACFLVFRQALPVSATAIVAVALCLAVTVAALLFNGNFAHIKSLPEDIAISLGENPDKINPRIKLWQVGIEIAGDHFWTGSGKGNFQAEMHARLDVDDKSLRNVVRHSHAHNEFINLWAELGVLGALSIATLYMAPFLLAIKNRFCKSSLYTLGIISLAWFLFGLTACPLAHQKVTLLLLLLYCLAFAHGMNNRESSAEKLVL